MPPFYTVGKKLLASGTRYPYLGVRFSSRLSIADNVQSLQSYSPTNGSRLGALVKSSIQALREKGMSIMVSGKLESPVSM